ncbi:hypothetical protein ACFWNT_47255 [Streptomyces sp. NPDC058409]|uniref:hypothetical protein n=1 Tax=Streptomyces sp. NPDC058409 TaxID=3346484 RepID=UPI00364B2784
MTGRKQAGAMDLPDYPCPPSLVDIATHAGSWGWFDTFVLGSNKIIACDTEGYLWVRSNSSLAPERETHSRALAAWTEDGVALFVPREAYKYLRYIENPVDEAEWTPVASVLKEPPQYALNFC